MKGKFFEEPKAQTHIASRSFNSSSLKFDISKLKSFIACPSAFYSFRKFGCVPELSDSFWILRGLSQIFSDTS